MSGLPNLPAGIDPGLAKYLTRLGQQFEVTSSDRGSPLMAKPTIQDLIDIGVLKANASQPLQANGKSFTLSVTNWLTSAIPDWFTALVNPPVVAGLTVSLFASNYVLNWTPWLSTFYGQTIIYRSTTNDLSTATPCGSTTGNTYVDSLPGSGVYYYWARNESKSKNLSDFNAVGGTTAGNVVAAPVIAATFDSTDLVLTWPTPTTALTIQYFIIRYGATFEGGVPVGTSNTNTLRITATFGGSRTFWIAAVDVNNQLGLAGSVTVTVISPGAPTVLQTVQNGSLVLTYSSSSGSLPIASYEVRYGTSFAAGAFLAAGIGTRFETSINWTGSRTFWIGAYDTAGNLSATTQSIFNPVLPGVVAITAQVIDNNVLLSWTAPIVGTLPIAYYSIDRNGTPFSTVAGRFAAIYETIAGTQTYGVTPVDTAGNFGARSTTTATMSQPPDFVLYSNANSSFGGTLTNTATDPASGGLLANVDTSETWATHFSSRGWTSVDDQIAAGYSAYAVGKTTGSYVEVVNYGAVIPATRATMTPTQYFANGTMTVAPTIEMGINGTTWPQVFPGSFSAYATSFQYARFTLNFSAAHTGTGLATDTAALLILQPLNYRLDVKQKTYQFMVSAVAGDAGGTLVDITGLFIDVGSIVLTALGTTALICVYDFVDAPNPTSLKVLVFNTSGARVSATVSGTIRGV